MVAPVLGLAVLDAVGSGASAGADAEGNGSASAQAETDAGAQGSASADASGSAEDGDRPQLMGGAPAPISLIGDVLAASDDSGIPVPTATQITDEVTGPDSISGHVASLLDTAIDTGASVSNNAIDGFNVLEAAADQAGDPIGPAVRAATGFAEAVGVGDLGGCNVLSAVAGAPGAVLEGRPLEAVHDIFWESEKAVVAGGDAVNQIVDAVNISDPLGMGLVQNAAGAVGDVVDNVRAGPLLDSGLLDLDGAGPAGNVLGAVLNPNSGALLQADTAGDGNASDSNNLIDLGAGPRDQHQGSVNVLNPGPGQNAGALEVNVLDVGSDGPRLVDADMATDEDALDFAGLPAVPGGSSGGVVDGLISPNLTQSGALVRADAAGDGTQSQSSNLIDAGAGPRDQHQGSVDVLNPVPGGNAGAVEVNVLDVGPDGPRLVDADLATDEDTFDFAGLPAVAGGAPSLDSIAPIGNAAIMDNSTSGLPELVQDLAVVDVVPAMTVPQTPFDLTV